MQSAATKFKGHPYSYRQGFNLIPTALHPVFTYSIGVSTWTMKEMQILHNLWGLMGKRAWDLTEGHNTAPFVTLHSEGGVAQLSPFHLAAKSSLQLLKRATSGLQTDILQLVQDEWTHLCRTWGTHQPQEIQAALLLSDSRETGCTLLSRVLYYLGHAGLVLAWDELPCLITLAPYDSAIDSLDQPLIGAVWSYVRQLLAFKNELRAGTATGRALASGIATLVKQGITRPCQLWSDLGQGWRIQANVTSDEQLSLLTALEHSFPGTARYSIAKALTVGTKLQTDPVPGTEAD
eukprot:2230056-Rhodomonas_salina.2